MTPHHLPAIWHRLSKRSSRPDQAQAHSGSLPPSEEILILQQKEEKHGCTQATHLRLSHGFYPRILPRLLPPSPYRDNIRRHPSNREMMYWSFSSPGPSAANLAEGRRSRGMGVSDAATPPLLGGFCPQESQPLPRCGQGAETPERQLWPPPSWGYVYCYCHYYYY